MEDSYEYDELDCWCNTDYIKCPYCGYEDKDIWDDFNENKKRGDCPNCGETYGLEIDYKIEFTSYPLEKNEGEKNEC